MSGVIDTAAISYHEWFVSLVRAGFTEDHAIYLVGQAVFAANMIHAMRRPRD